MTDESLTINALMAVTKIKELLEFVAPEDRERLLCDWEAHVQHMVTDTIAEWNGDPVDL